MNNLINTGRLMDNKIIQKSWIDERKIYRPVGVSVPLRLLCYNHNIPAGIKTKTRRVAMIIDKNDVLRSQPRRGIMIIAMAKIVESETRRVATIIENDMTYKPKTRRVDKITDGKNERRNYHPVGVSVPHLNPRYNHNIPLGLRITVHQRIEKQI